MLFMYHQSQSATVHDNGGKKWIFGISYQTQQMCFHYVKICCVNANKKYEYVY